MLGRPGIADKAAQSRRQGQVRLQQAQHFVRQGLLTGEGQVKMAHHTVGVRGQEAHAEPQDRGFEGIKGIEDDLPGKHRVLGGLDDPGQHHLARFFDGFGQKPVVFWVGGLAEEHVKDDEGGPGPGEAVDEAGVETAGPGPGIPQDPEGGGVDAGNENFPGWGGSRAQTAPQVQEGVVQGETHVMGG